MNKENESKTITHARPARRAEVSAAALPVRKPPEHEPRAHHTRGPPVPGSTIIGAGHIDAAQARPSAALASGATASGPTRSPTRSATLVRRWTIEETPQRGLVPRRRKSVVCNPQGPVTLDERATRDGDGSTFGDAVRVARAGAYRTAEDVGHERRALEAVVHRAPPRHVCGRPGRARRRRRARGRHRRRRSTPPFPRDPRPRLRARPTRRGPPLRVVAGLGQVGGRLARRLAAAGPGSRSTDVAESKRALA
jgi:leucine dehydrogenase